MAVPTPPSRPADLDKLSYEYSIGNLDQDHADEYAKKKAEEHAGHEITITATVVGDPDCKPGMALELQGTAFSGKYPIESVSHQFGMSGYTTTITAKGPSKGRSAE
jgi:phage protein D